MSIKSISVIWVLYSIVSILYFQRSMKYAGFIHDFVLFLEMTNKCDLLIVLTDFAPDEDLGLKYLHHYINKMQCPFRY